MDNEDWEALAKINRRIRLLLSKEEYKDFCNEQADYLEREHLINCSVKIDDCCHCIENFDREQFLKQCGVE